MKLRWWQLGIYLGRGIIILVGGVVLLCFDVPHGAPWPIVRDVGLIVAGAFVTWGSYKVLRDAGAFSARK